MHRFKRNIPLLITLLLLAAVGFAAMNSQNNLLFWAFGTLLGAVLLSLLVSHWMMRSIEIRRLDPKHGVVGDPMVVQYAITNRSRILPVFNLFVEEIERGRGVNWRRFAYGAVAWVMHIAPGETVHGEAVYWPRARGEMRFEALRVYTTFPFGIVHRSMKRHQETHTLVYPRLYQLKRGVLDAIVPAGPAGTKLSNRPGGGDDYFGLREYRPGDSRRQIAWKRSAGSDELIIKERTLPSPPRLRIALNLTVPTGEIHAAGGNGIRPRQLEERAISLAATMIESSARSGFEVGLAVLGFEIPTTPLRSNHWHVEKIMGALASIDLDRHRVEAETHSLETERSGVVVVHPGRVEPAVLRSAEWHFSAMQMLHLVRRRRPHEPPIFAAPPARHGPSGGEEEARPFRPRTAPSRDELSVLEEAMA